MRAHVEGIVTAAHQPAWICLRPQQLQRSDVVGERVEPQRGECLSGRPATPLPDIGALPPAMLYLLCKDGLPVGPAVTV